MTGILATRLKSTFESSFVKYYIKIRHENIDTALYFNFDRYFIIYTDYANDYIILWNTIKSRLKKDSPQKYDMKYKSDKTKILI